MVRKRAKYAYKLQGGGGALFLSATDITVYTENLKGETPRTSEFSKFTKHKLNIQTIIVFLYSRNEHMNMNLKRNTIYNDSQKMKYSGVYLTKKCTGLAFWKLHNAGERN